MSTKYIASNWRLPNEENSNKSDNYGLVASTGGRINIATPATVGISSSFSFWFKRTNVTFDSQPYGIGSNYGMYMFDANGVYIRYGAGHSGLLNSTELQTALASTDWVHWVITREEISGTSSQNIKIYANGELVQTQNNTNLLGTGNSEVNAIMYSLDAADDFMSEFAIFDYVLSESQISTLYGSSSLGAGNPMALKPAPVAFYPLGDNSASNPLTQPNEAVEDASVFEFDGSSNDFIAIDENNDKLFQGVNAFTVSAWAKLQAEDGGDQVIVGNDGSTRGFFMGMLNSPVLKFFISTSGSSNDKFTYSNPTTTLNNWMHVVVIWDGTNMDMYVNGMYSKTQVCVNATGTFTAPTGTTIGKIGQSSSGTSTYDFDGQISNVQIWYQRLSHGTASVGDTAGGDIATLYNSGVPLLTGTQPQEANLKAWYKLDQSANWEVDSTGNWQIPDAVSAYPQSFDFGTSRIQVSNQSLGITSEIAISAWIKIPDGSTGGASPNIQQIVSEDSTGGASRNWNLSWRGGGFKDFSFSVFHSDGTATFIYSNVGDINDGKWHHVVGTWDGTTNANAFKIYVDNVATPTTSTKTGIRATSNVPTTIGAIPNTFTWAFDGNISNVQIWDTGLDSTQVETLYNNGVPLTTAIASDNLKGWWKLDNTATFSTNWSIPDASGNGNTGTSSGMTEQNLVNNNVSVLNGESSGMTSASLVLSDLSRNIPYDSYSFSFDGTNDYIDLGTGTDFNFTGPFTLSVWAKKTGTGSGSLPTLFNSPKNSSNQGGYILCEVGNIWRFYVFNSTLSNWKISQADSTIVNDTWYNITAIYDGSIIKLYVNGVLQADTETVTSVQYTGVNQNAFIGEYVNSHFNGVISNVSLFNQGLTSTEVQKLYANGVPQDLTNFNPQPVAWYPLGSNSFWNGSAWTVRDMIGSNDGTGQNIGVDGLVGDAPRSEANGTGTNMDIPTNLEGSTKWSDNNSWSINMSSEARTTDVP